MPGNGVGLAGWLGRWTGWVGAHAGLVVVVAVLVTLGAGAYTVEYLGIDTENAGMLSEELVFRQQYDAYKEAFPQYTNGLTLVVEGDTPETAEAASERLATRLALDDRHFKRVYRPGGGEYLDRHGLLLMDTGELDDLADRLVQLQPFLGMLTGDPSLRGLLALLDRVLEEADDRPLPMASFLTSVDATIEAALNDRSRRLSWQTLFREDDAEAGPHRAIVVAQPIMDWQSMLPGKDAIDAARNAAGEVGIEAESGLRLRMTGDVALAHEELLSLKSSAWLIVTLVLVMVLLVLFVGLRSPRLVLATLISLVLGVIWTTGFAALAVGDLNLISVAFAVLYIGLGVDFAIHWCLRYADSAQAGNEREALQATARDIGPALVLCAVTTALAFYAFLPTDFVGLAELGLIGGTGMLIALIASLTLLPALLRLMGAPRQGRRARQAPITLTDLPLRYPRSILTGALVLALASLAAWPSLPFAYDPMAMRNAETESVRTFRALEADSPLPPLSAVTMVSGGKAAASIAERLRALDPVDKAMTLESFVPDNQSEKLAILTDLSLLYGPTLYLSSLPASPEPDAQREALAQSLGRIEAFLDTGPAVAWREPLAGLYATLGELRQRLNALSPSARASLLAQVDEDLFETLPLALQRLREGLQAGRVSVEALPEDLRRRWVSPDGLHRVEIFPAVTISKGPDLRRFVSAVRRVAPDVTGAPVLMLEAGRAVVDAFREAFTYALAAIALLLAALLRSVAMTGLILIPLLLGGLYTGGTMWLAGLPFNFANVIALPLLLGIGSAYGIHLVQRARGISADDGGVLRTSTARAMFFSAITTVVSFGNLAFSDHPGTASMGILLTMGVLLTLAATLLVLPALLRLVPLDRLGGRP